MTEIIQRLIALTTEEQAIYRQAWIEPADARRLEDIRAERAQLLNVKRALQAGCDPIAVVPAADYPIDQPGAWRVKARVHLKGARLPIASAAELKRELVAYQEGTGHAAD